MQKILLTSLVALSLNISSASFSQETSTTTTEQPAAAANTDATETETVKSEDQTFPVSEEPKDQIGAEYIEEEHGDWKIVCISTGKDNKPNCRVFQLLKDESGGAVAELSMLTLSGEAKAAAGVNFVTPLGTLLSAQVAMSIDAADAKRYPFAWCEKLG